MLDVKRKLESITSFVLPQSSPTVVQAILKRVKGTESWERNNLRKNTQENVAMVKDPEVKFSDYVKPQRKLNSVRCSEGDDASSSGSGASFDSSECKTVQFDKFVEEICFLSCPPDENCVKESEECKAKVLAILGLESCPKAKEEKGDVVIEAVCKARKQCPIYPKISMVPINDEGTQVGNLGGMELEPCAPDDVDAIMSCAATTPDAEANLCTFSSEDTDTNSHNDDGEDGEEIIPIRIVDDDDDEDEEGEICPIRTLSLAQGPRNL